MPTTVCTIAIISGKAHQQKNEGRVWDNNSTVPCPRIKGMVRVLGTGIRRKEEQPMPQFKVPPEGIENNRGIKQ